VMWRALSGFAPPATLSRSGWEFGPVWAALACGAAGRDLYPDFLLDDDAG